MKTMWAEFEEDMRRTRPEMSDATVNFRKTIYAMGADAALIVLAKVGARTKEENGELSMEDSVKIVRAIREEVAALVEEGLASLESQPKQG